MTEEKVRLSADLFSFLNNAQRPLIVILGPTASGKTGYSLALAKIIGERAKSKKRQGRQKSQRREESDVSFDSLVSSTSFDSFVEIINADSRQLYKHLDIGTAKITREEMVDVPHHLIDVLDPKEELTAAWYKKEAENIIDEILERKNIPMLVGGSMLYISAVIDGLDFPQSSDPVIRKRLEEEYDRDGGVTLLKRLEELDPETAAAIPRQNKAYVVRALEMIETTGKKKAELKITSDCKYDLFIIGIERPREELVARINIRTKQMIDQGWIDEVQSLLDRGYGPNDPGMKSHGYREIMDYLSSGSNDRKTLIELISAKTRQYAKRQKTWWKGDERIWWIVPI